MAELLEIILQNNNERNENSRPDMKSRAMNLYQVRGKIKILLQ